MQNSSGIDRAHGLYWHCEVAAMVINQLPTNPYTKQHVREAIRHATNSVFVAPRFASRAAKPAIEETSDRKGLVREHVIPVSTIIGKVLERTRPILHIKDGNPRFLPIEESVQWRLSKAERNSEKAIAMGNIRAWEIADLVKKWTVIAWVTKSEDERLRKHKLHNRMPSGWDGENLLARYQACGIECLEIRQTSS